MESQGVDNLSFEGRTRFKLEIGSTEYSQWVEELTTTESYILKELGFCFYNISNHPHKFILYLVKLLDGSPDMAQTAWNFLNDSCRLDLALRYDSQVIACAAIYMSIRVTGTVVSHCYDQWWAIVTDDFNIIEDICEEILELYYLPKVFIYINEHRFMVS
jgi:cyclin L